MIQTLLLLDLETGGLDPKKDPIVEIGVVLWSVKYGTVLKCWSTLIEGKTNEAEAINRIPAAILDLGMVLPDALQTLRYLSDHADILISHRTEFDFAFLAEANRRYEFEQFDPKKVVCSKFDIEFPNSKVGDGLVHIALANGVAVTHAHRALTDSLILARIFERVWEAQGENGVVRMIERARRPRAVFQAIVPYDRKDEAKSNGFSWDPERKRWWRKAAIEDATDLFSKLPFKVVEALP